jgi:hypothetical protein
MDWASWVQDIGKKYANSAIDARYNQQFELDKMKLQALGPLGGFYTEGQAGRPGQVAVNGIPTSWLLIGGLVAVVLLVGD